MIDPPKLLTTTEQRTAVIRLTIPRAQIQQVMGPAIGEVFGAVAAQGLTPAEWLWETYLTDPVPGSDPATWRTELTRPLM